MKIFFLEEGNYFSSGQIFVGNYNDYRHLIRVKRIRKGESLQAFDTKSMTKYLCKFEGIYDKSLVFSVISEEIVKPRLPEILIFQGLIQKNSFERELEILSELGVNCLVPLSTKYSQNFVFSSNYFARLKKISVEGAKKVGNPFPMEILEPINLRKSFEGLEKFLDKFSDSSVSKLLLTVENFKDNKNFFEVLFGLKDSKKVFFAVGSEGGFSREEEEYFLRLGFQPVHLGKEILLRSDTVSIGIGFCLRQIRFL